MTVLVVTVCVTAAHDGMLEAAKVLVLGVFFALFFIPVSVARIWTLSPLADLLFLGGTLGLLAFQWTVGNKWPARRRRWTFVALHVLLYSLCIPLLPAGPESLWGDKPADVWTGSFLHDLKGAGLVVLGAIAGLLGAIWVVHVGNANIRPDAAPFVAPEPADGRILPPPRDGVRDAAPAKPLLPPDLRESR